MRKDAHFGVVASSTSRRDEGSHAQAGLGKEDLGEGTRLAPELTAQPLGLVSSARAMLRLALLPTQHAQCVSVVIIQWSAPPRVDLARVRALWVTTPLVPEELLRA